jgi:hypothetical protein
MNPTPTALLLCLGLAACASAPSGTPIEVADEIVAALDAGQTARAESLFEGVAGDEEYRDRIYPVLFEAARDRYGASQGERSSALLEFAAEHYPDSLAVREALVYSLFLERAGTRPDRELLDRTDRALEALRERRGELPPWAGLVETQQAIDRGELDQARDAYVRFRSRWDGRPEALGTYVDDLERYLTTH